MEDYDYDWHLALCRNNTPGTTKDFPCDPRSSGNFYFFLKDTECKSPQNQNYKLNGQKKSSKRAAIYEYKSIKPGRFVFKKTI